MVPIVRRMVWNERARFLITACGIAFLIMLMFFLGEVYEGVKAGSVGYILQSRADLWICSKNSTNLLRSSSFLPASAGSAIRKIRGVLEVSGILRMLCTTRIGGAPVTLFIFGFDPDSPLGSPRTLTEGTAAIGPDEIIVDQAFAAKHGLHTGDSMDIQEHPIRIAGICKGTNAVVAQFAFMSIGSARALLGLGGVASFFLVKGDDHADARALQDSVGAACPAFSVFSRAEFVENTLTEMKTGVLPILWTVAVMGCVVGVAVMMLMLYGSVFEKREDYALLKALGAGHRYLTFLVIRKALMCSLLGFILGFLLNRSLDPLLTRLVPELYLEFRWSLAGFVLAASLAIGIAGSWLSIVKVIRFSPAEVFRA
jgi:putative ABC transport system permease protein